MILCKCEFQFKQNFFFLNLFNLKSFNLKFAIITILCTHLKMLTNRYRIYNITSTRIISKAVECKSTSSYLNCTWICSLIFFGSLLRSWTFTSASWSHLCTSSTSFKYSVRTVRARFRPLPFESIKLVNSSDTSSKGLN